MFSLRHNISLPPKKHESNPLGGPLVVTGPRHSVRSGLGPTLWLLFILSVEDSMFSWFSEKKRWSQHCFTVRQSAAEITCSHDSILTLRQCTWHFVRAWKQVITLNQGHVHTLKPLSSLAPINCTTKEHVALQCTHTHSRTCDWLVSIKRRVSGCFFSLLTL